jgi:hypothetical protein
MVFTGRPMRGMVTVAGADLSDDTDLNRWVAKAVRFAISEPPKPPKPTKKPRPSGTGG